MFYKISENGQIESCTTNEKIAQSLGMVKTEEEIVTGYDGKLYFKSEEPQKPEPTYAEKRAKEYPSIPDQLDMIYWDRVNATNIWQEKIAEIKEKYPKE
jgi:hypothetical protein